MKTGVENIVKAEQVSLVDKLQALLEKQIELLHQGESAGKIFESLNSRTDELVKNIVQSGFLESPKNIDKKRILQKLYSQLNLALTAQKEQTLFEMNKIRRGKKIREVYRSNI